MKKLFLMLCAVPILAGCTTANQAAGTMTGATFGSIIGSSIGGIMGGPRGSDFGTLVGMIAGAAVGNAATAPQNVERRSEASGDDNYADYRRSRYNDDSYTGNYNAAREAESSSTSVPVGNMQQVMPDTILSVQNLRFIDDNRNQAIDAGETAKVIFEIMNRTGKTVYDVVPYLSEASGNKHIAISPTTRIESIAPGFGVRYTATIKADEKLDDGTADFRIAISHSTCEFRQVRQFQIRTIHR
jgi:hypothetical protein